MKIKPTSFHSFAARASVATAVLSVILTQPALFAAPIYWDGNGTTEGAGNTTALLNKVWGTDSMWNSDPLGVTNTFTSATAAGDDLFFVAGPSATSGQTAFNPTVTNTQEANSITFQSQGAQTLSGGTAINLGAGGLVGSQFAYGAVNRGAVTISTPISLTAAQIWTNNAATAITVSGAISGAGDLTTQNNAAGTFTISTGGINHTGSISNSGSGGATTTISGVVGSAVTGITQNSATSALTLSGGNAPYIGNTTLTAGTLNVNHAKALGTGSLVINGGALNSSGINTLSNTTYTAPTITASTTIALTNTADLAVGQFVYGAGIPGGAFITAINPNTSIILSATPTAGTTVNLTFGSLIPQTWAADFSFTGTGNLNLGSGTISLGANAGATRTISVNANTLTLGNVISDGTHAETPTVNLAKTGSGTLSLNGASTYTGVTSILAGTVTVTQPAPNGSAGTLGNSTSEILVGDTTGSLASTLQTNYVGTGIARNIRVQSGNTGLVTLNANGGGSGTGAISGNITLGTDSGTGHGVTLAANQYATANYTGSIQDPTGLSGAGGVVTISPSGTLILSGNNTFSGGITLTKGTLITNHPSALGSGTLTINGGTLSNSSANNAAIFANPQVWAGNFSFGNNNLTGFGSALNMSGPVSLTGTRTISISILGLIESGVISETSSGFGIIYKGGTGGNNSLTLNGANNFSGGVTLVGGSSSNYSATLVAGNASALGSGQATLTNTTTSKLSLSSHLTVDSLTSGINTPTFTGGTGGPAGTQALVFAGGGGTGAAGTATISGGAITAVTITSYGQNYTSAPTVALTNPGGTGVITSGFGSSSIALGNKVLTIAGTNASPATYSGIISGSGGSLVKNGTGTQILTGSNTYTGATTINDGTLKLGASGSINNTSGVSLGTGGTFDVSAKGSGGYIVNNLTGSGDVIGSLTVSTQLAIGNSPGTSTFDNLTLGMSSTYYYELIGGNSPGVGSADLGIVEGDLAISGAILDLFQLGDYTANNKFTLFAYTGTLAGTFTGLADGSSFTDAGGLWQIDYNDTSPGLNGGSTLGASYVTITAVPEPAAALLGGLGLLVLLRRRR